MLFHYLVLHLLFVDSPQSLILLQSLLGGTEPPVCNVTIQRQVAHILLWEDYDPATVLYTVRVAEFLLYLGVTSRHCLLLAGCVSKSF